jgi:hypothetical protein
MPLARVADVRHLPSAVDVPRVAEVRHLPVDALARVAEVASAVDQFAVADDPRPVAGAEAGADPAADACDPPARDLRVEVVRVALEPS